MGGGGREGGRGERKKEEGTGTEGEKRKGGIRENKGLLKCM